MAYSYCTIIVSLFLIIVPSAPSPIMVKFGTNEGPIVPPPSTTTTTPSPSNYPAQPAPVYENQDDLPNPNVYKPLVPHQYRKKIYGVKPSSNLILGTPLDRKYTPALQKYVGYQKVKKAIGLEYTGPQAFVPQEYEKYQNQNYNNYKKYDDYEERNEQRNYNNYQEPQQQQQQDQSVSRSVPQIGIVYSAGVRYYVPQIVYYTNDNNSDDIDNSVYEANDLKYYRHNQNKNYY